MLLRLKGLPFQTHTALKITESTRHGLVLILLFFLTSLATDEDLKKVETCFAVIFVIKYIRHIYNCIPCIYKLFYQNLKLDAALVKVNA